MQTYIVVLRDGRKELVTAQERHETDEALEFRNGARVVARFVAWEGWILLGHVA